MGLPPQDPEGDQRALLSLSPVGGYLFGGVPWEWSCGGSGKGVLFERLVFGLKGYSSVDEP